LHAALWTRETATDVDAGHSKVFERGNSCGTIELVKYSLAKQSCR